MRSPRWPAGARAVVDSGNGGARGPPPACLQWQKFQRIWPAEPDVQPSALQAGRLVWLNYKRREPRRHAMEMSVFWSLPDRHSGRQRLVGNWTEGGRTRGRPAGRPAASVFVRLCSSRCETRRHWRRPPGSMHELARPGAESFSSCCIASHRRANSERTGQDMPIQTQQDRKRRLVVLMFRKEKTMAGHRATSLRLRANPAVFWTVLPLESELKIPRPVTSSISRPLFRPCFLFFKNKVQTWRRVHV